MHGCSAPEHRAAARLRTRLTDPQPRLRRHCQHALIRPQQSGPPPSSSTLARLASLVAVGADERLDAPSCRVVLRCRGRTPGIADRAGRLVRSCRAPAGAPGDRRYYDTAGYAARGEGGGSSRRTGAGAVPGAGLTVAGADRLSELPAGPGVKMRASRFSKDRSDSGLSGLRPKKTASLLGIHDRMDSSRTPAHPYAARRFVLRAQGLQVFSE